MNGESISIPIEYHIRTTSDWTTLQIVEGGRWGNTKVKCVDGCDRLSQEILFNDKTIVIRKSPRDESFVRVEAKCTLNIDSRYADSYISYLITKGDINSTSVAIIIQGKEIQHITNSYDIGGNPQNPMPFNVPTNLHLSAFKEREIRTVEKRIEANQKAVRFRKNFEGIFAKKNPNEKDVEAVFRWLRSHGKYARTFLDTDMYENMTFETETHFMQFSQLKKKVSSEAEKTLEEITRRYDKLRETYGKLGLQTPFVGGEKEERKVAPKK